jgi:PAS domain S-box-containing protein
VVHPDDLDEAVRNMALGGGKDVIRRFVRKDGTIVWGFLSAVVVQPENGAPYWVGVIQDITAFKRAEELLRESEERFRLMFEQSAAGMAMADDDGRYLQVNQAFCRFVGRSPDELRALTHYDLIVPEERDAARKNLSQYTNIDVIRTYLRNDGTTVWGHVSAMKIQSSTRHSYWVGVIQDVTAQKKAEVLLRESEERFRIIANDTPAYLWVISYDSGDGRSFINQRLSAFLGVDTPYLGDDWIDLIHPDDRDRVLHEFSHAREEGREFRFECRCKRADGEYRWVIDEGIPRYSSITGKLLGYAGCLTDITERRRAEEQVLALSDRVISAQEEERTRIAGELHDDLSQQVAAANLLLSGIKSRLPESQAGLHEEIEIVRERLGRIGEMVRNISHRLYPAILKYAGLAPALRAHCADFASLTGVVVRVKAEDTFRDLPDVVALCIYRVAQEALQNVAKHAKAQSVDLQLTRQQGSVCLIVRDTGLGFDLKRVNNLSSGLGLVSMRERVRLVGGTLELMSRPKAGTTVTACVPISAVTSNPRSRAATSEG